MDGGKTLDELDENIKYEKYLKADLLARGGPGIERDLPRAIQMMREIIATPETDCTHQTMGWCALSCAYECASLDEKFACMKECAHVIREGPSNPRYDECMSGAMNLLWSLTGDLPKVPGVEAFMAANLKLNRCGEPPAAAITDAVVDHWDNLGALVNFAHWWMANKVFATEAHPHRSIYTI